MTINNDQTRQADKLLDSLIGAISALSKVKNNENETAIQRYLEHKIDRIKNELEVLKTRIKEQ